MSKPKKCRKHDWKERLVDVRNHVYFYEDKCKKCGHVEYTKASR